MQVDDLRKDAKTLRAVELNFIVIGEAATHVPADVQQAHAQVRAMRNRIVHSYFSVDPQIVWDTVQNDLPQLLQPLNQVLATLPPAAP
jgi:uncharacterized protein with HEPN domain